MSTISSANSATSMNLSDKQVTECQELLKKLIQAPVVQILDSAIHRIYHYPANKYQGSQLCYPMDRDLFSGQHYPPFKQLAPGYYRKITKTSECLGTFVGILHDMLKNNKNKPTDYIFKDTSEALILMMSSF